MQASFLQKHDPLLYSFLQKEQERQANELELIASENYVSQAVLEASGSIFTNKYSEGYPGKRYYAGQIFVDAVENMAISRARELFGGEHINVQPLSGSPANLAVYFALLTPGDTVFGMNLDHGGHLSHGHPLNYSGKTFRIIPYGVEKDTERIDMEKVRELAQKEKPKLIITGFSAYSRDVDWKGFRAIADEVGAILMADISHIAGLIAGKALENPVPYCDVVTTTTHKTLRGPRGAIIICREKYAKDIDRAVFPGIQGGPHEQSILAKAVAFGEALTPEFRSYVRQVIDNARQMAKQLEKAGIRIISGGTDNHLMLLDVYGSLGITGKEAEVLLEKIGISTNKNMIPFDTRKPLDPSGIRLGTAAITTRGFDIGATKELTESIIVALKHHQDAVIQNRCQQKIRELCQRYPIPSFL